MQKELLAKGKLFNTIIALTRMHRVLLRHGFSATSANNLRCRSVLKFDVNSDQSMTSSLRFPPSPLYISVY